MEISGLIFWKRENYGEPRAFRTWRLSTQIKSSEWYGNRLKTQKKVSSRQRYDARRSQNRKDRKWSHRAWLYRCNACLDMALILLVIQKSLIDWPMLSDCDQSHIKENRVFVCRRQSEGVLLINRSSAQSLQFSGDRADSNTPSKFADSGRTLLVFQNQIKVTLRVYVYRVT